MRTPYAVGPTPAKAAVLRATQARMDGIQRERNATAWLLDALRQEYSNEIAEFDSYPDCHHRTIDQKLSSWATPTIRANITAKKIAAARATTLKSQTERNPQPRRR
jgi:hypothetical protein